MIKEAPLPFNHRQASLASVWSFLGEPPPAASKGAAKAFVGVSESLSEAPRPVGIRINNISAHKILKRGIPSRTIAPLSDFLGLGVGKVAEYLDLDRSTALRRAAKDQNLPIHAAEGVLRLLELDQIACDTFETEAQAADWLRRPHPMLEGDTPLEAAKSSYGAERVKDILLALKYGGVV